MSPGSDSVVKWSSTPGRVEVVVERDIKEVVGVLMRVLGGGEILRGEVEDLAFEAEGALEVAVNEAYIKLLEFAYDRDARQNDLKLDGQMRAELQKSLDEIVRLSEPSPGNGWQAKGTGGCQIIQID